MYMCHALTLDMQNGPPITWSHLDNKMKPLWYHFPNEIRHLSWTEWQIILAAFSRGNCKSGSKTKDYLLKLKAVDPVVRRHWQEARNLFSWHLHVPKFDDVKYTKQSLDSWSYLKVGFIGEIKAKRTPVDILWFLLESICTVNCTTALSYFRCSLCVFLCNIQAECQRFHSVSLHATAVTSAYGDITCIDSDFDTLMSREPWWL